MAVRTCVGCRESGDRRADDLVRLVLSPDGDIVVDLGGKLPGRGAWVHTRLACLERVAKRPQSLRLGHRPSGMDALPAVIRTRVVAADKAARKLLENEGLTNKYLSKLSQ